MLKYFIIFLAILNIVYAQDNTTNKDPEYKFTYEKENNFIIYNESNEVNESDSTNTQNEVSIMLERRGFPLVNRLVRFTSLHPDMFDFEIDENQKEEILLKEIDESEETALNTNESVNLYSNVYVVPTDENGIAKAKINLKNPGNGVVLMHILYVGSTGNTNISYEEYAYVNIKEEKGNKISSLIIGDGDNVNIKSSILITSTLFPSLFLVSIALIFISYFKHIYEEYRNSKSKIIIYTFFGFASIKKNFALMIFIILTELLIVACFLLLDSYIFSVILIAFFIAGFLVKREKIYAIAFFILACISTIYLYLETFSTHMGTEYIFDNAVMGNPVFVFFLFLILTALAGGIYIPICILILYQTVFVMNNLSLVTALIGIFAASALYIVKVKKDIPFLYRLNLLKIKDNNR
ncbi:hypothetical protein [Brachyspira hyodysenteriae]|uniref:Uncharacterized protein n=2 Tax=Brachyspira hyodysenteriae TaxID=159 RepID=A0A3B6VE19_BRAHW|nr:hypothetical protein [Brachyspira hyodysenteriae]ACN84513.1 hypothetical protein BHWA1_02054 [Brachyspira hyodysenteriae WA1]ANN63407.1 hypothetical protein BHYOB78_05875 [Brachyspira hyodysenteriae ATCC 27164]KLI21223.1 hypothetical protein SU43_10080 [Brachyspira hyodysenteriae]KLI24467.1 hypothetical protein SZ47_09470 [Brachyspira hyodysenteriae]KLI34834.1 hypothetical protein SZ48_03895 [Brachyspira hyodysenteriae]